MCKKTHKILGYWLIKTNPSIANWRHFQVSNLVKKIDSPSSFLIGLIIRKRTRHVLRVSSQENKMAAFPSGREQTTAVWFSAEGLYVMSQSLLKLSLHSSSWNNNNKELKIIHEFQSFSQWHLETGNSPYITAGFGLPSGTEETTWLFTYLQQFLPFHIKFINAILFIYAMILMRQSTILKRRLLV